MDVLKPPCVYLDGACYRKNPGDYDDGSQSEEILETGDTVDQYGDYDDRHDDNAKEEAFLDCDCPEIKAIGDKFQMNFHVASEFFAPIIGKKGATKKRIEATTKARISIPKQGSGSSTVAISAMSEGAVRAAWIRIRSVVDGARARHEFTHFLSLPANSEAMREALAGFKKECLDQFHGKQRGVDPSVFQDPGLLHLTIGTMALMDEEERRLASSCLEKCKEEFVTPLLSGQPLVVKVEGLEIMNDDPSEVDVVYAKVSTNPDSDVLQRLADGLVSRFVAAGLMVKQYERVKLHLTLMNTLFRTESGMCDNEVETKKPKSAPDDKKSRETLDARDILAIFGNHRFVEAIKIHEIHLSQRRAGRRAKDGYYWPSAKVTI